MWILAACAAAVLASPVADAGSGGLTYKAYRDLSSEVRARLVGTYVRKSGDYWQVALDSYAVRTDISAEKALAHAVEMDEFYRTFSTVFVGPFKIRARPELYVLKDKASYARAYKEWARGRSSLPGWSAGVFASAGPQQHALFGCAEYGEEQLHETLFHEGTHQLLRYYVGAPIPVWFNEGCATNFQTWRVDAQGARNVHEEIWRSRYPLILYGMHKGQTKVPLGDGRYLPVSGGGRPDLEKLMQITPEGWSGSSNPAPQYAQAWGAVHFLLTQGETGRRYFNYLLAAFRQGRGRDLERLMPERDRKALAAEWAKYLDGVIVPHVEYSRPAAAMVALNRLAEAERKVAEGLAKHPDNTELAYFKGLVQLKAGRAKEAFRTLEALEQSSPRHPGLMDALGRAALDSGDRLKAKKFLTAALAEDPSKAELKELLRSAKSSCGRPVKLKHGPRSPNFRGGVEASSVRRAAGDA